MLAEQKALSLQKARQFRALSEAETKSPTAQTNYDVRFYDIWMRIDDTAHVVYGKVTFIADAVDPSVSSVDVDFYSNMTIDSIVSPGGSLTYTRSGNVVTVNLDQTYSAGAQFQFDFWYHGTPVQGGFQAFEFSTHGTKPMISTLSEPYFARTWWPCKDRMDDKADSFYTHIEVDTGLYCASNGILDSITPASPNSRTFHHTMRYPMASYLFSLAIYPYVVWTQNYVYNGGADTMPIVHHVYPDWDSYSRSHWGMTPTIMAAEASYFGQYPFIDELYGHANFNWSGGMEHQTMTSMVGSTFGFDQYVVAHEMAHQWWGDMITCRSWEDIWLNEGWASYAEALWAESQGGMAAYRDYLAGMRYTGSGTIWVEPADTNLVGKIFDSNLSYDKAAWVLHMLRGVLGDSLFFQGIQAYYNSQYKYGSATTEDCKNVFEAATGQNLDDFFNEWIYGQKYPIYEYEFLSMPADTGGFDTYLYVQQQQTSSPTVFHMPVRFAFDYASLPDDTLMLQVDAREKMFKLHGQSLVNDISLDPLQWILRDANKQSWRLHILTQDGDLSDGQVGQPYLDTVVFLGGTGSYQVGLSLGTLPSGLSISNEGIISGTPQNIDERFFNVVVFNPSTGYADTTRLHITIDAAPPCCVGTIGNVDGSADQMVTLSDLSALIDALFISLTPVQCVAEANIDQSADNQITLGDLSALIDHLFISLAPYPACP